MVHTGGVFDTRGKTGPFPQLRRTPSDEYLLTELAIDRKNITIMDISTAFLLQEKMITYEKIKCYMDHATSEFFIEVTETTPLRAFTQNTVLSLLDKADNEHARKAYFCIRKDIKEHEQFVRTFKTIGMKVLTPAEQARVSMTTTHTLLEYDIENEGDADL